MKKILSISSKPETLTQLTGSIQAKLIAYSSEILNLANRALTEKLLLSEIQSSHLVSVRKLLSQVSQEILDYFGVQLLFRGSFVAGTFGLTSDFDLSYMPVGAENRWYEVHYFLSQFGIFDYVDGTALHLVAWNLLIQNKASEFDSQVPVSKPGEFVKEAESIFKLASETGIQPNKEARIRYSEEESSRIEKESEIRASFGRLFNHCEHHISPAYSPFRLTPSALFLPNPTHADLLTFQSKLEGIEFGLAAKTPDTIWFSATKRYKEAFLEQSESKIEFPNEEFRIKDLLPLNALEPLVFMLKRKEKIGGYTYLEIVKNSSLHPDLKSKFAQSMHFLTALKMGLSIIHSIQSRQQLTQENLSHQTMKLTDLEKESLRRFMKTQGFDCESVDRIELLRRDHLKQIAQFID